jgi:hypothetical protein
MRETTPYPGVVYSSEEIPDVDVFYLEWRWRQHHQLSADRRNEPDWDRQSQLLDEYHSRGTPIIAFDTDLKIGPTDLARWPNMIVAEPSLSLEKDATRRTRDPGITMSHPYSSSPKTKYIRLPWATDFRPYYKTPEYSYNYIYLGNNYERDEQFSKYYGNSAGPLRAEGIQTIAYGNWIERSPARADPADIIKAYPNVAFAGRASYNAGMQAMSKSICTTMLAKAEYYRRGFITSRIYEGILAGIPSLVPVEHEYIKSMGLGRYVVKSSDDVVRRVRELSELRPES